MHVCVCVCVCVCVYACVCVRACEHRRHDKACTPDACAHCTCDDALAHVLFLPPASSPAPPSRALSLWHGLRVNQGSGSHPHHVWELLEEFKRFQKMVSKMKHLKIGKNGEMPQVC